MAARSHRITQLSLVLCDDLEVGMAGREAPEEGTYVYLPLIHIVVWQKTKHCKAVVLQLKIKIFKIIFLFSKYL